MCENKDEDDCIFYFSYDYDENNNLKIDAQITKRKYINPQTNFCSSNQMDYQPIESFKGFQVTEIRPVQN